MSGSDSYASMEENKIDWNKYMPIIFLVATGIYTLIVVIVGLVIGFKNHFQGILSAIFVLLIYGSIIALTLFVRKDKLDKKYIVIIIVMIVSLLFSSFFIFSTGKFKGDKYAKWKAGQCVSCKEGSCVDFDKVIAGDEVETVCYEPKDAKLVEECGADKFQTRPSSL
ncbi:MAG: hypothetical protein EZS28_015281 [Streblomastix strix]|uniref:Uncharacterized protein n=1 Tax=Streblomastix strix TaxID=222440 RepID=A0A5J4W2P1_9EUKA|nr:MAG: hypothetical protein EZS28_015281 [Streblomastix strix]